MSRKSRINRRKGRISEQLNRANRSTHSQSMPENREQNNDTNIPVRKELKDINIVLPPLPSESHFTPMTTSEMLRSLCDEFKEICIKLDSHPDSIYTLWNFREKLRVKSKTIYGLSDIVSQMKSHSILESSQAYKERLSKVVIPKFELLIDRHLQIESDLKMLETVDSLLNTIFFTPSLLTLVIKVIAEQEICRTTGEAYDIQELLEELSLNKLVVSINPKYHIEIILSALLDFPELIITINKAYMDYITGKTPTIPDTIPIIAADEAELFSASVEFNQAAISRVKSLITMAREAYYSNILASDAFILKALHSSRMLMQL